MNSHRDKNAKTRSPRETAQAHEQPDQRRPAADAAGRRAADEMICVRLTRKYADLIDGVDLSSAHVGDRIDLSPHDAEVLIAEGWAERAPRGSAADRSVANDRARRRRDAAKDRRGRGAKPR